MRKRGLPVFALCVCLALTGGCASVQPRDEYGKPVAVGLTPDDDVYRQIRFSEVPVPSKFKYDRSRSFVYESGTGKTKVGRLFFTGWASLEDTVTFYQNEMVNKGWKLVRVMEHEGTILLYDKEGWVCTVVVNYSLGQSQVEVQIGPK